MKIVQINKRDSILVQKLLDVWESSVKATHLFLSVDEINNIKQYVPQAIKDVSILVIAENKNGNPVGFMGVDDKRLEMLFVLDKYRGQGIGKQLLQYGIENYSINELTVNEQNPRAKGFYEHMGFEVYKRTELDEQGNPYPLLYMKKLINNDFGRYTMVQVIKKKFVVIGKEGSTLDGEGFIQKLWNDANSHFNEIAHLAKKEANGKLVGIWGAMSDISRSFKPWEDDFSKGLYLAGVECFDDAKAPDGWTKWTIPGYEYIVVENHEGVFEETIRKINEKGIALVGAVHDYTDPATGKDYLYFPIREL